MVFLMHDLGLYYIVEMWEQYENQICSSELLPVNFHCGMSWNEICKFNNSVKEMVAIIEETLAKAFFAFNNLKNLLLTIEFSL